MNQRSFGLISILILASLTRFLPHPPNMTPIIAISILSVAGFNNRMLQFGFPLMIMFLTDMVIGFHKLLPLVYMAMMLAGVGGLLLKKKMNFINVLGTGFLGSVIFFVITNLGVFLIADLYPKTLPGLTSCFVAALPFFHNTVIGTVAVLMGIFSLMAITETVLSRKTSARMNGFLRRFKPINK